MSGLEQPGFLLFFSRSFRLGVNRWLLESLPNLTMDGVSSSNSGPSTDNQTTGARNVIESMLFRKCEILASYSYAWTFHPY